MTASSSEEWRKVWNLIKNYRSALLVTLKSDGSFDSRPMGCLQRRFDGALWFITFHETSKLSQIGADERVLVSYAGPRYEYVSIFGKPRLIEDKAMIGELWKEGLRVWFPNGPDDSELALIAIDVEAARYWTQAASTAAYAWLYIRARLTGKRAGPAEVVDTGYVQFRKGQYD
jgi:general stress protein 26